MLCFISSFPPSIMYCIMLTIPYPTFPCCLTLPYHTILPFTLFNPTLNLLDPTDNFHPFTPTTLTFTLSNPTLNLLVTLAYSQLTYPTLPFNYTFHSFPLNLTLVLYSNLPYLPFTFWNAHQNSRVSGDRSEQYYYYFMFRLTHFN